MCVVIFLALHSCDDGCDLLWLCCYFSQIENVCFQYPERNSHNYLGCSVVEGLRSLEVPRLLLEDLPTASCSRRNTVTMMNGHTIILKYRRHKQFALKVMVALRREFQRFRKRLDSYSEGSRFTPRQILC